MDAIAVTDLIKKLGYKNPDQLAKNIYVTLNNKSIFTRYLVRDSSRPEKLMVTTNAEILIDNLAILFPFHILFGKGDERYPYAPIKYLQNKKERSEIKTKAIKFLKKD